MLGHARVFVSKTDQFWEYAKEAILSACYAKTDEDKQALLELARKDLDASGVTRARVL